MTAYNLAEAVKTSFEPEMEVMVVTSSGKTFKIIGTDRTEKTGFILAEEV